MRDCSNTIAECAYDTGYDYDFLEDMVIDEVRNGNTYENATEYICGIAYEYDF